MVTTVTPYTDSRNRASPGEGYDGVVRLAIGGFFGTGALLYDGRAILTAAHLFTSSTADSASVYFETAAGSQTLIASHITVLSSYDATQTNNDLALVWLTSSAPLMANRYNLYRSSDEIGQTQTTVGYGLPGTGNTGTQQALPAGSPVRLKASNQFDADAATLKSALGSVMSWTPTAGTQLVADFDNGSANQDALGRLMNRTGADGTGLGQNEGLISPGDSGGPAFINGQIAGVASYTSSLSRGSIHPDIDSASNRSFGELGFWQRVSYYQQWVDQSLRAHYPDAPTQAAQVQKSVIEGASGNSYAYFLVQLAGVRSEADERMSVDFATRDGTATQGQDYVAARGTMVIYLNENQAVIPVEIIGDNTPEPDETFYLDVFNPVGGSFGAGVVTLTAMRTIVNDDIGLWS